MRSRLANFAQSDAKRLFKATAGVRVRVEFRPAGRATAEQEKSSCNRRRRSIRH